MRIAILGCVALACWMASAACAADRSASLTPLFETIRQVDREAKGNRAATEAWSELTTKADASQLTELLAALDGAGPLAANWLRAAVDTVAQRHVQQGGKLPVDDLQAFLDDKNHDPRARRLAYEWIVRADPAAPARLVPTFLDDPSLELRRDAVAQVLEAADKAVKEEKSDVAIVTYRKALDSARDLDQVKAITEALKKLGQPVDLAHHYGLLQDWQLIGPFDNHGGKGFDVAYPPETEIELTKKYPGTSGDVGWIAHHTDDEYAYVDFNKAVGKHMGAVGYAYAIFNSDAERPAELRLGSENAIKIWLNGKLLTFAEAYHANGAMDQYVGRGTLRKGRNEILLKICQNEQKGDWAQNWQFLFRVCDSSGKAILATDRPGPRAPKDQATAQASTE